jgi:hypothetical protein
MTANGTYATEGIKRWLLVRCPCGCQRGPFQVFANARRSSSGTLQYATQPHAECYADAREEHAAKARVKGKSPSTFQRNMTVKRDSWDVDQGRAVVKSIPFFIDEETGQAYRQTP